ncbi:L-dopachrome tautomerase-related protein [Aureivirga marina]|uniref:L-dopachrome tautomerase-related protein n=1 Tax=Aureivirga marina TaxID=1182451 RepID=UPI0018C9C29E|nr:L-dopachrome tautomerase-related protein [Aureivirga marina]
MKKTIVLLLSVIVFISCKNETKKKQVEKKIQPEIVEVASIKGEQLTGVTVSKNRMFVNFPRWRKDIKFSVAEVKANNDFVPYPDESWNQWKIGEEITDSTFVAVQSVVSSKDKLYVIDTRNPLFQGVLKDPVIFVFDLNLNKLVKKYVLPKKTFFFNSYINDIRIDPKRNLAFMTDSGHPGLVILDLGSGKAKRILTQQPSTTAENIFLKIDGVEWKNKVHSDGIAIDLKNQKLYYHALTGYNLYALSIDKIIHGTREEIANSVELVAKTSAPDGMIIHNGILYYGDLENHKIMQMNLADKKVSVLVEGDKIKWADTFSVEGNELYFTNSRIHESAGDISNLVYTVNKIKL